MSSKIITSEQIVINTMRNFSIQLHGLEAQGIDLPQSIQHIWQQISIWIEINDNG